MIHYFGEIPDLEPDLETEDLRFFIIDYDQRTTKVSISKIPTTRELTIPETVIIEGRIFKVVDIENFGPRIKDIFIINIPISLLDIVISNIKSFSSMLTTINIVQTVNDICLYEDICFLHGDVKFSLMTNIIESTDKRDICNLKYKFPNSGSELILNDLSSNYYFKIPYKIEHAWKIQSANTELIKNYQLSEVEYNHIENVYKNTRQLYEILISLLDKLTVKSASLVKKRTMSEAFSFSMNYNVSLNLVLRINCPNYDSNTDTLYSVDKTKLIKSFNRSTTTFKVPENVNTISKYAFYNCRDIKFILLPESVSSIEDYAFCNCPNLIEICIKGTLPKNIKIGNITVKLND